jgi:ketosteroid isomerase-like protein
MSQLNLNVVRSVYDAFDSEDMPAVLQHLDDDVEVFATDGLPWSGTYYGKDGFEDFITTVRDHVRLSIETDELFASGECVAQVGRTIAEVHATGASFDTRSIHIWRLRNGKVVSFQNYPHTDEQRRALGLPPSDEPPAGPPPPGDREAFWS